LKKAKKKAGGILTKVIIAALLVYAVVSLVHLQGKIESSKDALNSLQEQVNDKAASNEDMAYAIEHSEDEDILKEVARDKLGLAEYDEKVFYAN